MTVSYPGGTSRLDFNQIEQEWIAAGGDQGVAPLLAGIAESESGGSVGVLNDNPSTRDYSVGLWQINYYGGLLEPRTQSYGPPSALWTDPLANARAAVNLYAGGSGLQSAWGGDHAYAIYQQAGGGQSGIDAVQAAYGGSGGATGPITGTAPSGPTAPTGAPGPQGPQAPGSQPGSSPGIPSGTPGPGTTPPGATAAPGCDRSGNSFSGCFCGITSGQKWYEPWTWFKTPANLFTQTVPCIGQWFYNWIQRLGLILVGVVLGLLGLYLVARDAGATPAVSVG